MLKAGDVIIVKAGTYKFTDTIVINNAMNGKSGAYIVVKAADGAEVKFDFSAQTLDGANSVVCLIVDREITGILEGNHNLLWSLVINEA